MFWQSIKNLYTKRAHMLFFYKLLDKLCSLFSVKSILLKCLMLRVDLIFIYMCSSSKGFSFLINFFFLFSIKDGDSRNQLMNLYIQFLYWMVGVCWDHKDHFIQLLKSWIVRTAPSQLVSYGIYQADLVIFLPRYGFGSAWKIFKDESYK